MSQVIKNLASGPVPPSVATSYVTDNGTAIPAANVLNVLGGTGIITSADPNGGNTIHVTVVNDSFTWSEKTTSFAAAIQNGYYCNAALTATLPATAGLVLGNTIIIYVDTASAVVVQANTGQMIQFGDNVSGPAGTLTNTMKGDTVELNFKPSDSTWHTIDSIGSWSVV